MTIMTLLIYIYLAKLGVTVSLSSYMQSCQHLDKSQIIAVVRLGIMVIFDY